MSKATILQLPVLSLAAVLAGSAVPAAAGEERSAAAVLNHHVQGFAAGDLDAMLADYAAGSVLITPDLVAIAAEITAGERAVTTAMREAGSGLKTAWRGRITGPRLR